MKNFMSIMLGLSLVLGSASIGFAEDTKDAPKKESKKKAKKGAKKAAEKKVDEKK